MRSRQMSGEASANSMPAQADADAVEIGDGHADDAFAAHLPANAAKRARYITQHLRHQRYTVIIRLGRGPCADVIHPGAGNARLADGGNDGDGLAVTRQHQEPGPCRAFPELGGEACEVTPVGRRGDDQGIKVARRHLGLRAVEAGFVLSAVKATLVCSLPQILRIAALYVRFGDLGWDITRPF
jgi:hypothetical protein